MAAPAPQQSRSDGISGNGDENWSELRPKSIDYVKVMSPDKVALAWERIYKFAGLRNPSEKTRKACRLGVYVYCYKNGTSREGEYSGDIVMADGHRFEASVIVKAVGKMDVRRFMRGNAEEAYRALKGSRAIEDDETAVAKVAVFGIRAEAAFAVADFFDMCSLLTPAERLAHDSVFTHRLQRAERARGSKSLEEVEEERLGDFLHAQERSGGVSAGNTF